MPDYRIYQLGDDGHSTTPPLVVTCEDDAEAEEQARKILHGSALEVWCGPRKVATLKPDQ